ncbi:HAD-IIIC family phosphatase [Planctomycetales bacterium ZRK34]|nr:HAD-IIIC family phosphatase [Planctomycetales bacterium ZRK34]
MIDQYAEAEKRYEVPSRTEHGRRNENPPGMGLWQLLREDFRTHDSNILEQGFWAIAVNRFGNWRMSLRCKILRAPCTLVYRVMFHLVEWICGITLPYSVKLGRRVRIWHHGGIILGARYIGDDVHIRQGVTLGVAQTFRNDQLPIIDRGVQFGCGACVLGRIYVGADASIGANSTVLDHIPQRAVVMGNPAKVVMIASKVEPASPAAESDAKQPPQDSSMNNPKQTDQVPTPESNPPNPATAAPRQQLGVITLLGSTNLDYLAMNIQEVGQSLGVGIHTYVPPFGQSRMQLLTPNSPLIEAKPAYAMIVERAPDVLGDLYNAPLSIDDDDIDARLAEALEPMIQLVHMTRQKLSCPIFVLELAVMDRSSLSMADSGSDRGVEQLVTRANQLLKQSLADMDDIRWLPCGQMIAEVGRHVAHPGKYWHLGRVPFSNAFSQYLAKRLIGAILFLSGKTARVLALDLDNTLWGGVLGEDGMENLKLGRSYPGSAFREFQTVIKAIAQRGVALTIVSKNDEDLACQMIRTHPEMVLRMEDFTAWRINWQEKSRNIDELLDELNLGHASCLFIDDNPVEREKVRRNCPDVIVPEMPTDPSQLAAWLLDLPWLETLTLTTSDFKRVKQYKQQSRVNAVKRSFANIEDFFHDLQMQVTFEPYGSENQERILQLLNKTNQFNTTTHRHDAGAIRRILDAGGEVFAVGVQDRFSDYELMGVVILVPDGASCRIDSFLLSCRILGRTVETAALSHACERAIAMGAKTLVGQIIETERNTPVRDVYERHQFCQRDDGLFELDLERPVQMPVYFKVMA